MVLSAADFAVRRLDPARLSLQTSWHFLLREAHRPSSDPEIVWEHIPGYRRRLPAYEVRINSLGLRGPEIAEASPEGGRILCLGDSFTFGSGVEETETWPARLAETLANRGLPAECVNAGVNGYGTLQEAAWLRNRGWALRPSAVVLYWVENDFTPTGAASGGLSAEAQMNLHLRRDPAGWKRGAIRAAYDWMPGLTGLLRFALLRREYRGYDPAGPWAPPPPEDPGRRANLAALLEIRDQCRERGVPFLVAGFLENLFLAAFCRENEIPYAPALPRDRAAESRNHWLASWDPHLNPEGYRLVAVAAAGALASQMENGTPPEMRAAGPLAEYAP